MGLNNLLSIFVDDKSTQSLIYCGRKIKSRNTKFNRFNAKLNESISEEATEFKTTKKGIEYAVQWSQRGYELKRLKTYLIERRNRYFDNEFHKLSKSVVEFLIKNKVFESTYMTTPILSLF